MLHDVSPDLEKLERIGMFNIIASVLLTFAVAWSKTSFAVTLLRLIQGRLRWLLWTVLITVNLFMGITGILVLASCSPIEKTWNPLIPGRCWPLGVNSSIGIASAGRRLPPRRHASVL
jgi:hypothetical protein